MKKPNATNNLAALYPALASQWHPTRNGDRSPDQYTPNSNEKFWWRCSENDEHEWEAVIASRHKAGCPICYNDRHLKYWVEQEDGSRRPMLLRDRPELFTELVADESERSDLGELYVGSGQKLNWSCRKCHQQWSNTLRKRAIRGQSCTYCANQTTYSGNSLLTLHPVIAAQWDYGKNSILPKLQSGPGLVNPGSHYKAWWKCIHGHSWCTEIRQRVKQGTECPKCNPKVSKFELRIGCELEAALGLQIERGRKIKDLEADLTIPRINVVIEVDGYPWHSPQFSSDALERDKRKNTIFQSSGYYVLRVRERRLPSIDGCITVPFDEGVDHLLICKDLLATLAELPCMAEPFRSMARAYKESMNYLADIAFQQLEATMRYPAQGESLMDTHPKLALEWCVSKNLPLTPQLVKPGSSKKVCWQCANGHKWDAAISSRTRGNGCPQCSGNIASIENNLAAQFPQVAAEWDYASNGKKTPQDVTPKSSQKYSWHCNHGHKWEATVNNRTRGGQGCPYCGHKLPSPEWNLLIVYPEVARFFHESKNAPKSASDVLPNSGKIFWWRCELGHEWQWSVDRQSRFGPRCRSCNPNNQANTDIN